MKKIGFIDYRLDEWHANNYPAWIDQANRALGYSDQIAWAWAEEAEPEGLLSTRQWCEKFGVGACDTIEEVCQKSDVLLILAPSNPEKHLAYAEIALRYGKPTYMDKTFAPDAATAKKIFDLADRYGAKLFSTSALRYAEELKACASPARSVITTGGGSSLQEYVVHQLEMIVCLMGKGAKSVLCHGDPDHAVCAIDYGEGRFAVLNYGAGMPFTLDVQGAAGKASRYMPVKSQFFPALLTDIVTFYETGVVPVDREQTIECMALREAVLKAAACPGRIAEV